jgi:hypothetical protein
MLDIVATAIARCKLQVLSIFLTYLSFPLFFVPQGSGVTLPLLAHADC